MTYDQQQNGYEISGSPTNTESVEECSQLCVQNSDCNYWRWHTTDFIANQYGEYPKYRVSQNKCSYVDSHRGAINWQKLRIRRNFWGVLPPVMSKIDRFVKTAYVFGGNAFTMVATFGGGSEEGCDIFLTFVIWWHALSDSVKNVLPVKKHSLKFTNT